MLQVEYLRHEMLDRVGNIGDIVHVQLLSHQSLDPEDKDKAFTYEQITEIRRRLDKAQKHLGAVYQFIGEIHL